MNIFVFLIYPIATKLVVDRSGEYLTLVPINIDSGVTTLILNANRIKRIEDTSVASLAALEVFKLDGNRVNFISTNAFLYNIKLSRIAIAGHSLPVISPGLGNSGKSLVYFTVPNGRIFIPATNLTHFPKLERLGMNTVRTNSLNLGILPSLKSLYAQGCNLQTFPDLSNAPMLNLVQLHDNNFSYIPPSALAGLSHLKRLHFPNCRVTQLPDLSHLTSLESFNVQNNQLKSVPDMYDLPFTLFKFSENPLLCDETLCWIRMWGYVKSPLSAASNCQCKGNHLEGLLMDVHPLDLKCYKGKFG